VIFITSLADSVGDHTDTGLSVKAGFSMNTAKLLERLLEAEGAVGKMNPLAVQALLRDAEDIAIGIQRQFIELLEENERMRRQQRTHVRKSVHPLSDPRWEIEAADPLTIN
jgi:hypothetical protein